MTTFTHERDLLEVPGHRVAAIREFGELLRPGMTVALSTHMNADGDGCGSETALARLLAQRGIAAHIVNPTPWPEMFRFLLGDDVEDRTEAGADALRGIDALIVMDINDVRRLGTLASAVRALDVPMLVVDHHIAGAEPIGAVTVADVTACATGELVFDIATALGLEITPDIAQSLYAALLTDTGSFRFSNTSPRCHAIAGVLLASGVDPEEMYRRIYAQVSVGRLMLLRDALSTLKVDSGIGLSWISVEAGAMEKYSVTGDELDGIVEHPRSIAGTRMAIFFRDLGHGKVKVSFRSTGAVNVQKFAGLFDGGGHAKASGALIEGGLAEVETRVIEAAREFLMQG